MKILYIYEYDNGGFADMIKFFLIAVFIADKYNLELNISINHPINNYLCIQDKYICNYDYSNMERLTKEKNLNYMIDNQQDFIYTTLSYFDGSINSKEFPNTSYLTNNYNFFDYIDFSPLIYDEVYKIMNNNKYHISIHLRCGDKYVRDSKDFLTDTRINNVNYDNLINNIINKNINTTNEIYFFCDNEEIKNNILTKYEKLKVLFNDTILHFSYNNSDKYSNDKINETFKQTLIEFLFIHLSNEIQSLTPSGFSLLAHLLRKKQNKFVKYYKLK